MSLSEELPLYKDTLNLLNLTLEKTKSYPKYYRYTLGEKMININLDISRRRNTQKPSDLSDSMTKKMIENLLFLQMRSISLLMMLLIFIKKDGWSSCSSNG